MAEVEVGEDFKVSARSAAKIEYGERPFTLDVLQHRCDILADVVIASAFPEIFGMLVATLSGTAVSKLASAISWAHRPHSRGSVMTKIDDAERKIIREW